jgi:hypothetical protein
MSAQVLLVLGAGIDNPVQSINFQSDLPSYFFPAHFSSLAAGCLQQHALGPDVYSKVYETFPLKGFSTWALQWHLGVREVAAWDLWQQQQQQQGLLGEPAAMPTEAAVIAAVQRAYASPDAR